MENEQIGDIFDEIADLLALKDANPFRIRSYRNAARTVRDESRRIEEMVVEDGEDLTELPDIGDSTADKIKEIVDHGSCKRLEELRDEFPPNITELMEVPNLGPRKVKQLYDELNIANLDELRKACEEGKVRELEGMGEKTEQNILSGIETVESTAGRILWQAAAEHVDTLGSYLDECKEVERWEVAGSFRRRKETVGDLDILVHAEDRETASDRIAEHDSIHEIMSRGEERLTVRLDSGLQVDFRFFEPETFGSALMYFTGSKAHNIAVRKRAQERDWKLNEYGLLKDEERLAGNDEESVYHRLNMAWVPPELRENRGELEAAGNDELPTLIELEDVRGDLQSHTNATDGSATIEEMAKAARDRGLEYLAITDHSQAVSVAGGLDDEEIREHADNIREVSDSIDGIELLAGVEVDVLKDGKLDLEEDTLAELDWVVASMHYNLNLSEDRQTDRLISAVKSGVVHCLGHPLNRVLGKRDPLPLDTDKLIEACAEHGVYVEINAQPDRLDLPDTHCKRALEAGVRFTFGTDAHKEAGLDFMRFAVGVARRGWLEANDVVNTLTLKQLREEII
ncbi:MAG: DNA polymerase/3'-5' exonuclease PolX [Planctomycetes bacterium]|nr:DNA polymerase/3'-5' exonuclease PolX [Planctomycetota bacterium]